MGLFGPQPVKKLQKEYEKKMRDARDAQRAGDIQGFAVLSQDAEHVLRKIEALKP